MWGCVSVFRCLQTEVGTESCDAGVTGSCKLPKMGAGVKLKVSQPLRRISSSEVVFYYMEDATVISENQTEFWPFLSLCLFISFYFI